jgi:murein DD-endopeptidase MepM/ murein hydrolase activator NlpD
VYAAADGVVTFSGRGGGTWGRLIVIRHDPLPDSTVVWSRSAHIRNPLVSEGDRVTRGQQIATVGSAEGMLPFHLHFDIAKTNIMELRPGHWPGTDLGQVLKHYVDPRQFIEDHRPPGRA